MTFSTWIWGGKGDASYVSSDFFLVQTWSYLGPAEREADLLFIFIFLEVLKTFENFKFPDFL